MTSKVAVCTLCINDWYGEIVKYGVKTIQNWAEKHGYDFYVPNFVYDECPEKREYPWYKIKAIQYLQNLGGMKTYDYIIWIDADGHILKPELDLEYFLLYANGKDILCTKDVGGVLNTGVMIIKNTPRVYYLFNKVWYNEEEFDKSFHEQASLSQIFTNNRFDAKNHIEILPDEKQSILYTYWRTYYPDKTFFIHIARSAYDRSGLMYTMDHYCPIRMDEDTDEEFQFRMRWLQDEKMCRGDIERWMNGGYRTNPSSRVKKLK